MRRHFPGTRLKSNRAGPSVLTAAALLTSSLLPAVGHTDVILLRPSDGQVVFAQPCPFPVC